MALRPSVTCRWRSIRIPGYWAGDRMVTATWPPTSSGRRSGYLVSPPRLPLIVPAELPPELLSGRTIPGACRLPHGQAYRSLRRPQGLVRQIPTSLRVPFHAWSQGRGTSAVISLVGASPGSEGSIAPRIAHLGQRPPGASAGISCAHFGHWGIGFCCNLFFPMLHVVLEKRITEDRTA